MRIHFLKTYLTVFFVIIKLVVVSAEIIPTNNATIHFTTVYFEEEFLVGTKKYSLLISKDSLFSDQKITKEFVSEFPAFWAPSLNWGSTYFWKVARYNSKGVLISTGKTHKFSIVGIGNGYFDEVKLKIIANKIDENQNDFVAIDNTRSIFNRKGEAVWTIPKMPDIMDDFDQTRNLILTHDHTILLLANNTPLEMDFDGNIIWKGPDNFTFEGDTVIFHHDLKKDLEGNYYVLGNRYVYRKLTVKLPQEVIVNEDQVKITDSAVYRKTEVGLILKFNKENTLLWFYDFNAYFKDEDLNYKKSMSGFPNFHTHQNAFSINASGSIAYVGFRDLSRIVKIDIQTKKVLATYGEKYPSGEAIFCNNFFQTQHDARITNHNTLLIFNNNNGSRAGGVSSVIEIRDTLAPGDSSLVWKMDLNFDTLTNGKSMKGGCVEELKNKNLFVCAGELNRIFEVARSKELVWDAFVLFKAKKDTVWKAFPQYRASVIEKIVHYHFLAQVIGKKKEKNLTLTFMINNTGNISDSYKIEIFNHKNEMVFEKQSEIIANNSSFTETLKFRSELKYKNATTLKITSIGSNSLIKTVVLD